MKNENKKELVQNETAPKKEKAKKAKPIKNLTFLRKGTYSIAVTAMFLAAVLVVNILVSALADRFVLEFDMSLTQKNSMNAENVEFVKKVDREVSVYFFASKESYATQIESFALNYYAVSDTAAKNTYYPQTLTLVEKYGAYNDKIDVTFVDTQTSAFSELVSKYPDDNLTFGDILVTTVNEQGVERRKVLRYKDIYEITVNSEAAAMGYEVYSVTANKIENALTGAIAYVLSNEDKTIGFITGHSATDYTKNYRLLLEQNNYKIKLIEDAVISEIPEDIDALVIAAPTNDFLGHELDAIAEFLDNNGKLGKGLVYFADVNSPTLTNLYEFLEQWGILIEDGVLFGVDTGHFIPNDPTSLFSFAASENDLTAGVKLCLAGYNVPLDTIKTDSKKETTVLLETSSAVVAAPKGVEAGWTGAADYEKKIYPTALWTKHSDYDDDSREISSSVIAFSTVEMIYSEFVEYDEVSNKNISLAAAEEAAGAINVGINFIDKTISNQNFVTSVTQAEVSGMMFIFMLLLPVILLAAGIYIYIKRRNA